MEGRSRGTGGAKHRSAEEVEHGEGRCSAVPLGDLGAIPRNFFFKNQLLNCVFSAYLQIEMVSPTVLARLSIKHYN